MSSTCSLRCSHEACVKVGSRLPSRTRAPGSGQLAHGWQGQEGGAPTSGGIALVRSQDAVAAAGDVLGCGNQLLGEGVLLLKAGQAGRAGQAAASVRGRQAGSGPSAYSACMAVAIASLSAATSGG